MERVALLTELFDDKTIKIINLFLKNPAKNFSLTEISEQSGVSVATAHRRMNNLSKREIVQSTKKNNAKKVHSYRLWKSEKTSDLLKIFNSKQNKTFSRFLTKFHN